MLLFEYIPTIFSTVLKHYTKGPPKKSWGLKFHLTVAVTKRDNKLSKKPIERTQKEIDDYLKPKIPSNITIKNVILDEEYRQKSKTHLEKILKQYDDVLDEGWKEPNDKGLHGEWMYINENASEIDHVILYLHGGGFCIGSAKYARTVTLKFVELADSRIFALDYRLSPQSQFPAALCDSVAAAGGNLVFATLLALRDAGLPLPAGAIALSPWVDLTHSMQSFWDAKIDKVDFVPSKLGLFAFPSSPVMDEYHTNAKALADKITLKNPTIVSHPSFTEVPRFNHYCANEALTIPYVRQQVGGDEKLHDEAILISHKAANPHEYQLPSYATKNFEKSPFKKPTKVILEVYDDMPHIWHMCTFFKPSQIALERCRDFIKRVISIEDNNTSMTDLIKEEAVSSSISVSPSFIAMRVSTGGIIRELNETDRDCLKWDKIG
ncbi:35036_t:CDS:2, partial [Racocetra persica]